jgi:hypothetical protein
MELLLEPGPLLQLSGLLRGIGLTDPPDVRVQYSLLRAFGVSAPKARSTDPSTVTKSWAGWIIHHVEQETSFAGEVAFQQWRRSALARLDAPVAGGGRGSAGSGQDGGGRALLPEPVRDPVPQPARPPADESAGARWARVLDTVRPELSMLDYFGVEDAVPQESSPEVLALAVSNEIAARALQRLVPRIERVLEELEERAVTLRVVVVRPE